MPDHCPKCGKEIEPGDVKCPTCGAELPEPGDPAPPQKAAVLAATLLPVIGVIVFLAFACAVVLVGIMLSRKMSKDHRPIRQVIPQVALPARPATANPTVVLPPPVVTAPISPPIANAPAAPLPVVPPSPPDIVKPSVPVVVLPTPTIEDFVPAIVPPGKPLVIRGQNLANVTRVLLLDSRGAGTAVAKIVVKTATQLIVTVPPVSFPDHKIFIAVFSPGGVAVLVEEHMGNTPWGTDQHLHHTAVNVRPGDEIVTLDHMLVFAMPQSIVSMGDNSIGFFSANVILKAVGKNCTIYYMDPLQGMTEVPGVKLMKKPSIELIASGPAFRVKAAPPDEDD